jgi:hypothetical protein
MYPIPDTVGPYSLCLVLYFEVKVLIFTLSLERKEVPGYPTLQYNLQIVLILFSSGEAMMLDNTTTSTPTSNRSTLHLHLL